MTALRSFGRAQEHQLDEFRGSAEARLLSRLAQTECLLDLSKLPGLRPDLASYAGLVVGIITQFIPSKCCSLLIEAEGLPPISSSCGDAPFGTETICADLVIEGRVRGQLGVAPEAAELADSTFVGQLGDLISRGIGDLVETERLRRQAAIGQTIHFIEVLADRPTTDDLNDLVRALSALPNALGARLDIAHSVIGGAVSLTAGIPPLGSPAEIEVPGGTVGVALNWALEDQPGDEESLEEILKLITAALARADERRQLHDQAELDPLTGVGNRRRAMRSFAAAFSLAERTDGSVGAVYLDLDFFKKVNDVLGHDVGDKVLVAFATHLQETVRAYDTVCRLGGEEFLIICPGLDERHGAALARRVIEATPAACAGVLPVDWNQTASAGVACFPDSASVADDLVHAADRALYAAKNGGRNQVQVASKVLADAPT